MKDNEQALVPYRYRLYPEVHEPTKTLCEQHLAARNPVNAGKVIDNGTLISQDICNETHQALQIYNQLCNTCNNHNLWCVAGGFAAFTATKTNTWSDIDIFVQCNSILKPKSMNFNSNHVTVFRNVVTVEFNGITFQIIQVPFNINGSLSLQKLDMFMAHLLVNFDLPLCRVAIKYSSNQRIPYILDFTSVEMYSDKVKEHRIQKYNQRRIQKPIQPLSLRQLCLFSLFKSSREKGQDENNNTVL